MEMRVTPIYTADLKVDPTNYRPISVLSVLGKLFEKTTFNQVYTYLNENNLLSKYQSGFRPMHSTLTALIDIPDIWYLDIDDGLTNDILFIDLKKAFDTIDHEILLSKVELYGFKGASLNLFRDYLSDRTQVTVINNVKSESSRMRCGVPQGSIVGPLLFLLYINDQTEVHAALRRPRPICPQSTLVTNYQSLIPHFDYCSAVWGCIGNGLEQPNARETTK